MAQPQTMHELALSIERVAQTGGTRVLPTLATRNMIDLPTNFRPIQQQMLMSMLTADNGVTINSRPGHSVALTAQTDEYFRTHDPDGAYALLAGIVIHVGQRSR